MATLADILVTLTLDTEEFNRSIQQVSRRVESMSRNVSRSTRSMTQNIENNTRNMSGNFNNVVDATNGMQRNIRDHARNSTRSFRDVANSSQHLSRTLGVDVGSVNRVLRAAHGEFNRFGMAGRRVSHAIRDEFMGLPSHLLRYVQRLREAGQSTEGFSRLAQQYGARVIETMRHSNDYLQRKTSQSMRLMHSFANDTNLSPLTNQFLRLGHRMEMTARRGTVMNLALQRIGTNTSLKNLRDQMMFIQQGIMRARGAFLVFGIAAGLAIYGMIKLASSVDKRVKPAFENMKKSLIGAMSPFIHMFATGMVAVMKFVTKVADMVKVFSQAHPVLFNMIMSIAMLTLVLGALLAPLAVTGIWAEGLAASFSALWMIISPFVLGVLAVIGVAIALAAAIVILWVSIQNLWKNSEAFRNAFNTIWADIKNIFMSSFLAPIMAAWNNLKTAFGNLVKTFTGGTTNVGSIWKMLGDKIAIVVSAIAKVVLPILKGAFQILGQIVVGIINGIIVVVGWLATMWKQHGEEIKAVLGAIWAKVQEAFGAISAYVISIMPQIQSVISSAFDFIKAIIDFTMKYIAPIVVWAFGLIWNIIKFLMPMIVSMIKGAWDNIKAVITSSIAIIQNVIQLFSNILKGHWKAAWENVKAIFKNTITLVWNLIQLYFLGRLLAPFKAFGVLGKGLLKGTWTGFMGIIKFSLNAIKTFIGGVWGAITGVLRGSFSGILNLGRTSFSTLKTAVMTIFNALKGRVSSVWEGIKFTITHPIEAAKNTVLKIIGTIVKAFASMKIALPDIKLPHLSIGSKSKTIMGKEFKVPTFDVSWNAKGNIFNGASILGGGQGVGEAGAEAVMPIQHKRYMKPFAGAVASTLAQMQGSNNNAAANNQYVIQFNEPVVIRENADIQRIVDELEKRRRIAERAKGTFSFA